MMKFTDLDFDCLENVLEYLELADLLNVADSTKRLRKAAELIYVRKYGKETVVFYCTTRPLLGTSENYIPINHLKTALQLLRCFGPVIYKIKFDYENITEQEMENESHKISWLFTYINHYCADYLEELSIYQPYVQKSNNRDWCLIDLLQYLDKPFNHLNYLNASRNNFTVKDHLIKIFPKLRVFHCSSESFYNTNMNHYPNLEELYITVGTNETVLALLKLNPQLKHLELLSLSLNINLLRNAVDSLQNIKKLSLLIKLVPSIEEGKNLIEMKKVKIFRVTVPYQDELIDHDNVLPFSFEQLQKFNIHFLTSTFRHLLIEQFFEFVNRHPNITHLRISMVCNSKVMNWTRLAESLPSLVYIDLPYISFSCDAAIDLIAKFPMLKRFQFIINDYDHYESLCKCLDNKWDSKYTSRVYSVELKRRI